jgi:asparagine synthase (glutamine-hydrolysing)
MFAFAIWDARSSTLLAARDRLGVKPFFYMTQGSRLVFASEVHSLFDLLKPSRDDVDLSSLDYYLAFGYVPPDRSIVRGVHKLPPAHSLTLQRDGLSISRYWQIEFRPTRELPIGETLDELDRMLSRAVRRRLVSDVPLGCFLSSGIDSGLVTAMAAQASEHSLRTYSVGFPGVAPEDDERPLARTVADRYGTQHNELTVEPADKALLPRMLWHYGEPFADASMVPTYQISKAARQHVTVALTGDGGDESFAGYQNVQLAHMAQRFRRRVPSPMRRILAGLVGNGLIADRVAAARRARLFMSQYVQSPVRKHYDLVNHWNADWRALLYADGGGGFDPSAAHRVVAGVQDTANGLGDAELHLYTDLQLRLPGDYLTKVDIASNIVSLEIRSPFLDHELVEFAARTPLSVKLWRGQQKGLLRQLAKRYLPEEVVRQPKRGFGPPLWKWLAEDWAPLASALVGQSLSSRSGLFRGEVVRRVVAEHLSGKRNHGTRLWSLVCLEIWWQLFIDRSLKPSDTL